MDFKSLHAASQYVNNLLLSRGLLKSGLPIEFARPEKGDGGKEGTLTRIVNVIHDLVLRRDKDAEQRANLATTVRSLRDAEVKSTAEIERLKSRLEDCKRQLAEAQSRERVTKESQKAADNGSRAHREELQHLKAVVKQMKTLSATDLRRRDAELQKLKSHLATTSRVRRTAATNTPTIDILPPPTAKSVPEQQQTQQNLPQCQQSRETQQMRRTRQTRNTKPGQQTRQTQQTHREQKVQPVPKAQNAQNARQARRAQEAQRTQEAQEAQKVPQVPQVPEVPEVPQAQQLLHAQEQDESSVPVWKPRVNLSQEAIDDLMRWNHELGEENKHLVRLAVTNLNTLRNLQGLPSISPPDDQTLTGTEVVNAEFANLIGDPAAIFVQRSPLSHKVISREMNKVLNLLYKTLNDTAFVRIEEVQVRDEEIRRLREGWLKMEGRWREAVAMMEGWRKRMASGGSAVRLEEIKMGLGLSPIRPADGELGVRARIFSSPDPWPRSPIFKDFTAKIATPVGVGEQRVAEREDTDRTFKSIFARKAEPVAAPQVRSEENTTKTFKSIPDMYEELREEVLASAKAAAAAQPAAPEKEKDEDEEDSLAFLLDPDWDMKQAALAEIAPNIQPSQPLEPRPSPPHPNAPISSRTRRSTHAAPLPKPPRPSRIPRQVCIPLSRGHPLDVDLADCQSPKQLPRPSIAITPQARRGAAAISATKKRTEDPVRSKSAKSPQLAFGERLKQARKRAADALAAATATAEKAKGRGLGMGKGAADAAVAASLAGSKRKRDAGDGRSAGAARRARRSTMTPDEVGALMRRR